MYRPNSLASEFQNLANIHIHEVCEISTTLVWYYTWILTQYSIHGKCYQVLRLLNKLYPVRMCFSIDVFHRRLKCPPQLQRPQPRGGKKPLPASAQKTRPQQEEPQTMMTCPQPYKLFYGDKQGLFEAFKSSYNFRVQFIKSA